MRLIFKVFFQIVCCSQSTLKSPHWSESKQDASSLPLFHSLSLSHSLYQHCLYLLYRSLRGAVRENTGERGERQSIVQGRKSTGVDSAPVCVRVCVWSQLLSLTNTDHSFGNATILIYGHMHPFILSAAYLRFPPMHFTSILEDLC